MIKYIAEWIAEQLKELPTVKEVTPVEEDYWYGEIGVFQVTYKGNRKFRVSVEEIEGE